MKILLLLLLTLPICLYSDNSSNLYDVLEQRNKILADENKIKNRELQLKYQEYEDKKRKIRLENIKKENEEITRKKAAKKALKEKRNKEAKQANERYYQSLKDKNKEFKNSSTSAYVPLKKASPDNYKGQPELKLGELHIYGITSIKPFKKDKFIIKARNGTFALPKDKFKEAEKINFTSELNY